MIIQHCDEEIITILQRLYFVLVVIGQDTPGLLQLDASKLYST